MDTNDIVYRLRKRAEIRRQIPDRKSVIEGKPDRIADLLEEAANEIERLQVPVEPPCKTGSSCIGNKCQQCIGPVAQVQVSEDYYPHVVWMVDNPTQFDQCFLYTSPISGD
jgi:hypothetical protein